MDKQVLEFNWKQKNQTEKRVAYQRVELKRLNAKYKVALDVIKSVKEIVDKENNNCSQCQEISKMLTEALFYIKGVE